MKFFQVLKCLKWKIPAIIAMLISVVSLVGFVTAIVAGNNGGDEAFGYFLLSFVGVMITSGISTFLYVIDSVVCIVEACKGKDKIFNIILVVAIYIGLILRTPYTILMTPFYFPILLVLEIISIIRHVKAEKIRHANAPETDHVSPIAE